jgi:hypothetical protein
MDDGRVSLNTEVARLDVERLVSVDGACGLLHSLRRAMLRRSIWRGATFDTIRRVFVKIALRVEEMKSRIKLAFPASYPQPTALIALTGSLSSLGP